MLLNLKLIFNLLQDLILTTYFNFYFFPYLGKVRSIGHPGFGGDVAGFTTSRGVAIALDEDYFNSLSLYKQRVLVSHEMTHVLMNQNNWNYRIAVLDSENMADEVAIRTAQADLTPIYTYQGKTLTEWIDSQK